MSCSRAWAGVLASAVWVVSTTELVGVHAKEGGERVFVLSQGAVRDVDDGGGSGERMLGIGEGGSRSFISSTNFPRNLFGLLSDFITARGSIDRLNCACTT
ncbi:hypothetical protein BJ322DRAFT_880274 [Thelephora terrestris]|uniref:Secreted protein n=1 Tax=Thelephora terrestris TaxID=56493 RepID=A0A9P6HE20_9AGAM|nr:hypothetical protein BJ322DRAFT_880274 [Thelephora terrestris]